MTKDICGIDFAPLVLPEKESHLRSLEGYANAWCTFGALRKFQESYGVVLNHYFELSTRT